MNRSEESIVINRKIPAAGSAPRAESVAHAQQRIVDEFGFFEDWDERYQNLVDFARRLAPMPENLRVDQNRIRNCRGAVWLAAEERDGALHLSAASETQVVAGLLAIIVEVYSGHSPIDVLTNPLTVLDSVGLTRRLSPHKQVALHEIVARLRELARNASVPKQRAS